MATPSLLCSTLGHTSLFYSKEKELSWMNLRSRNKRILCVGGKEIGNDATKAVNQTNEPFNFFLSPLQEGKKYLPLHDFDLKESSKEPKKLPTLGKDDAWGLVMQAVTGTGWVTASGLESAGVSNTINPLNIQSRSPRRRMGVEFTCNKCSTRTRRAINPLAYKEGTIFVQCKGCNVFHKLVDHLGLFHELNGPIFDGAVNNQDVVYHQKFDPFGDSK